MIRRHFRLEGFLGAVAFLVAAVVGAGVPHPLPRVPFPHHAEGGQAQADDEGHAPDGAACDGCCANAVAGSRGLGWGLAWCGGGGRGDGFRGVAGWGTDGDEVLVVCGVGLGECEFLVVLVDDEVGRGHERAAQVRYLVLADVL